MKSSPFSALQPGQRLNSSLGTYELIEPMGQSAFGPYWQAKLTSKGGKDRVLIAFFQTSASSGEFSQALSKLKQVEHPHLLPILGSLETEQQLKGIIHPHIEGTWLSRLLWSGASKRLTAKQHQGLLKQCAQTLDALHQQGHTHGAFYPEHALISKGKGVQLLALGWLFELGAKPYSGFKKDEAKAAQAHASAQCFNPLQQNKRLLDALKSASVNQYQQSGGDGFSLAVLASFLLGQNSSPNSGSVSAWVEASTQINPEQKAHLLKRLKPESDQVEGDSTQLLNQWVSELFTPSNPLDKTPEPNDANEQEDSLAGASSENTQSSSNDDEAAGATATEETEPTPTKAEQTAEADKQQSSKKRPLLLGLSASVALTATFALGYWLGQTQGHAPIEQEIPLATAGDQDTRQNAQSEADTTAAGIALPLQAQSQVAPALSGPNPISSTPAFVGATVAGSAVSDPAAPDVVIESSGKVTEAAKTTEPQRQLAFRDPIKLNLPNTEAAAFGPVMVALPKGQFKLGDSHRMGDDNEQPVVTIQVAHSFALSQTEVTFAAYDLFAKATGRPLPNDVGWGRGQQPVVNVSWQDATDYASWLAEQTGEAYRLPTEAEWEYAARAGTQSPFSWGSQPQAGHGVCDGCNATLTSNNESNNNNNENNETHDTFDGEKPRPVAQLQANPWGFYDMAGNVNEWVSDCYAESHQGRSPLAAVAVSSFPCDQRVMKGGGWFDIPRLVRPATRYRQTPNSRSQDVGFRVALDL